MFHSVKNNFLVYFSTKPACWFIVPQNPARWLIFFCRKASLLVYIRRNRFFGTRKAKSIEMNDLFFLGDTSRQWTMNLETRKANQAPLVLLPFCTAKAMNNRFSFLSQKSQDHERLFFFRSRKAKGLKTIDLLVSFFAIRQERIDLLVVLNRPMKPGQGNA